MEKLTILLFQATTDVANWPSLSEAPPASATSSSSAIKPKVSTSKSETSSINGEISKSGNDESSQGEQPQDGSKENQQNSTKNKKKKGKILLITNVVAS